jgi:hypothetical protein
LDSQRWGRDLGYAGFNFHNYQTVAAEKHKKGNAHMDKIIAGIGVAGAIAAIIAVKIMDLNDFVTAAIVILACAIAVITVARIKPKESTLEEDN